METYPAVELRLWSEDAIVLFDWMQSVDLESVPAEHPAVRQALTDLFSRLEEIIPYEFDLTASRVEQARQRVARDMGW
ncbi:hypothetical protein [Agromyces laixinhei]|uniref:hypothetical protein n=1 Tax=Agromyces laixinhei TaxID=2585717 RepID=UPI0012EDF64B|nr:hypothetical protein [Agromyces laixinhei]